MECSGDFLLEISGTGLAFLSSYGAVSVVSLDPGETYLVDSGHVVAFEGTVDFDVQRADRIRSPRVEGAVSSVNSKGRGRFGHSRGVP